MIASDLTDILTYRLKKFAQSGLPAQELAETMRRLLEAERAQKQPPSEVSGDMSVALFARRRAQLNVV